MRSFVDGIGREWNIDVSTHELRSIRRQTDFRLTDIFLDELSGLARLSTDYELLVDCLWICCADQAAREGTSEDSFVRALTGNSLADAYAALVEATIDFFPVAATRDLCRKILGVARDAERASLMSAMDTIQNLDPKLCFDRPGNLRPSQASTSSLDGGAMGS